MKAATAARSMPATATPSLDERILEFTRRGPGDGDPHVQDLRRRLSGVTDGLAKVRRQVSDAAQRLERANTAAVNALVAGTTAPADLDAVRAEVARAQADEAHLREAQGRLQAELTTAVEASTPACQREYFDLMAEALLEVASTVEIQMLPHYHRLARLVEHSNAIKALRGCGEGMMPQQLRGLPTLPASLRSFVRTQLGYRG